MEESLKKIYEANSLGKEKRKDMQSVMGLFMLEWQDIEGHLKLVHDVFAECFSELESKEKALRVFEGSVKQSCQRELDSRRSLIEAGLKILDEKEKSVKGVLKKIEMERMQFGNIGVSLGKQMKDVLLKEGEIQGSLKVKQSEVEKRQIQLDFMEAELRRREDETISKKKNLNATERILERTRTEIDSVEEKLNRRSNDLDVKERSLEEREKELATIEINLERMKNEVLSQQKGLEERENVLTLEAERFSKCEGEIKLGNEKLLSDLSKQIGREKELEIKATVLARGENGVVSKHKILKEREHFLSSEAERLSKRENLLNWEAGRLRTRENEINMRDGNLQLNLSKIIGREKEVETKETIMERRENEVVSLQKMLAERENVLNSEAERLSRRENEMKLRDEKLLLNLSTEMEAKARLLETLKLELYTMKNFFEQYSREADAIRPTKSAEVRRAGSKRNCPDGQEKHKEENHCKHAKGSSFPNDQQMAQIETQGLKISGARNELKTQMPDGMMVLNHAELDLNSIGTFFVGKPSLSSAEEENPARRINNDGET